MSHKIYVLSGSFITNVFVFTPMPQINTGTVLKYETLANLFSAEFFSLLYLILGYSLYLGL